MRIFGRRPDEDSDGPVATYAAILDGNHLWWHVDGVDRLLLRGDHGPDVIVDRDPFPLLDLTADVYDVLADGRPVLAGDLPDRGPARTPLARDGHTQYTVRSEGGAAGGWLRLVRDAVAETAVLTAVELRDERIHLRVAPPPHTSADALLLVDDDDVAASLPVGAGPTGRGELEVAFGAADLPSDRVGVLRVALGSAEGRVRIRRSDTGLADPNAAVLLPELADRDQPDRVRARLRWSPDSLLALRLLDPDAESG